MRHLILLIAACLIAATAWAAAPLRPYSGCGVLLAQNAPGPEASPLPFYAEPGLERLAELDLGALPRLSGDREHPVLAVYATKGGWLKLAWDDAGRAGWVEGARAWEYRSWDEYLLGRQVKVLPGLKKNLYALKGAPREASADAGSVSRDQLVRVVQVAEDWVRLERPAGWLRWRDADGRLTVSP